MTQFVLFSFLNKSDIYLNLYFFFLLLVVNQTETLDFMGMFFLGGAGNIAIIHA